MAHDEKGRVEVDPRVALAAERTVLAWFRTGIALMGFGFVVARFGVFLRELAAANGYASPSKLDASAIGVVIVGAGVLVNIWASARHRSFIQKLASGHPFRATARGPVAIGLATGVGGLILIAVLLGALRR